LPNSKFDVGSLFSRHFPTSVRTVLLNSRSEHSDACALKLQTAPAETSRILTAQLANRWHCRAKLKKNVQTDPGHTVYDVGVNRTIGGAQKNGTRRASRLAAVATWKTGNHRSQKVTEAVAMRNEFQRRKDVRSTKPGSAGRGFSRNTQHPIDRSLLRTLTSNKSQCTTHIRHNKITVKPALNGSFIKWKFVLNGNIFRSRDFGAEKDVKYSKLNWTV
jgi:hypothetical protein